MHNAPREVAGAVSGQQVVRLVCLETVAIELQRAAVLGNSPDHGGVETLIVARRTLDP